MALFEQSPLTGAISGNIGGVNFVAADHGIYVRQKRGHTIGATTTQLQARAAFQSCARRWIELTDAQRLLWSTVAASVKTTDRLGRVRAMTGRQFFFERNIRNLSFVGLTVETTPPLATQTRAPISLVFFNFAPGVVTLSSLDYAEPVGFLQLSWCARSFSALRPRAWRGWAQCLPAQIFVTPNVLPDINAALGQILTNEWIAIQVINRDPGLRDSPPVYAACQVTQP